MDSTIKKYLFKDGLKLEFEILDLGEGLKTSGKMMTEAHRAQFYHLLWIEKGKGIHYIDFNPITIEDNTLLFIPNNCVNKFDVNGSYKGKAILFTDRFFCKNKHDVQFLNSSLLFSDFYPTTKLKVNPQGSELKVLLKGMESEYQCEKDSYQYAILHNMLHVFLLQAEREIRNQGFKELKPGVELNHLMQFKQLLEENFHEKKSVNKFAALLNISEKQLHKATTSLLDKTPKQIIDERILLEAKRLLVHSSLSIKEIAYQLGYEEPTNFIKYFRKHTQFTPSEFRAQA